MPAPAPRARAPRYLLLQRGLPRPQSAEAQLCVHVPHLLHAAVYQTGCKANPKRSEDRPLPRELETHAPTKLSEKQPTAFLTDCVLVFSVRD